jgi:hypothetical protein
MCEYVAYDQCRYDVCILNASGKPRCIIEVKHTHETSSFRPEPWYELDASNILLNLGQNAIECERKAICDECKLDNYISMQTLIPYCKSSPCLMCDVKHDHYETKSGKKIAICSNCITNCDANCIARRLSTCFKINGIVQFFKVPCNCKTSCYYSRRK